MVNPLVDKDYLLEKFPGKGGWTFAAIPEILQNKHAHFGWVRVMGSIDGITFDKYYLMPMGNGQLFLPVKAAIRKKIKKEAGDYVRVILFADNDKPFIPAYLIDCLKDEPNAYLYFQNLSDEEQIAIIKHIESVKLESTKADRIAKLINEWSK